MKNVLCIVSGVIGSLVAYCLGGWDSALETLLIFMIIDYITGIIVAGVFKKSKKTKTGGLQSVAGFKGLSKKLMTLVFVMIGYRLDIILNVDYIRTAVIIAFTSNELISIVENAGLMGLPIPKIITDCIDILNQKGEAKHE